MIRRAALAIALVVTVQLPLHAQQQQRIGSVEQAVVLSGMLSGRGGPPSLNWIDGGSRFSYATVDAQSGSSQVRAFDPATQQDQLLFDAGSLRVPGTNQPLRYESFVWSRDSKHVVFQTDFRPIYRYSIIRQIRV